MQNNRLEHVTWGDIFPGGVPKVWEPIGKPRDIPNGALFIVASFSRPLNRRIYAVMSWHDGDRKVDVVKIGTEPAIYMDNASARAGMTDIAKGLNNAVGA